jgi:endonuclease YncB( thermonuclease family)
MKAQEEKFYKIMLSKLNRALYKDKPISVSFITKNRYIRPNKMVQKIETRKMISLNDEFINACRNLSRKRRESTAATIINRLETMKHDNNSDYFIIS